MNSPERIEEVKRVSVAYLFLRCSIAFLFPVYFLALVVFTVVVLASLISNISISHPLSVPCQCKIVSSSVDLKSAKVCELGLLNYKAKHVFHTSEKKKFRCSYDYYWASVFEVMRWNTQITLGILILHLQKLLMRPSHMIADPLSMLHGWLKIYSRSTEMLMSWFSHTGQGQNRYVIWEAIAGAVTGFLASLITFALGRMLYLLKSRVVRLGWVRDVCWACFVVAYFSFVGWLALQHWGKHGLVDIFGAHT